MHYKIIFFCLLIFINSCVSTPTPTSTSKPTPTPAPTPTIIEKKNIPNVNYTYFPNKGFALIYNDNLYKNKTVNGKLEDRSLTIFQKKLNTDTTVKITNLINSKYIIAKVGKKVNYPDFFNSVISKRISEELQINDLEPYIEIKVIGEGSSFIAKKAKTYDEEKNVANKAPIEDIQIMDLSNSSKKEEKPNKSQFNYILKIGDFYFENSANEMKSRIIKETSIKKVHIKKLSSTKFRVFIGSYNNLNSLKTSFNAINILQFENIEIIKK